MNIIAIIDADLIGRKKHRFPNLACEKLSAYYKKKGYNVNLKLDYNDLENYDQVFISKVFTDTPFPDNIKETNKVHLGGTGFFYDKAPNLDHKIEHTMPDYHLYDDWIEDKLNEIKETCKLKHKEFSRKRSLVQFKEYLDYSIGFLTRGCFRKCEFCVNKKYDHVFKNSPLSEFYDPERKKICLLDDNIFGYKDRNNILDQLISLKKPFKFKQGLDERLLNQDLCNKIFNCKYDGDYTFAFDNIEDYEIIKKKLELIRKTTAKSKIKFYVLVGFKGTDTQDIIDAFKRIELLMKYQCLPYIMKYEAQDNKPWRNSENKGIYITLARWCNQPSYFKKKSFEEYCYFDQRCSKVKGINSSVRYLLEFKEREPEVYDRYMKLKFSNFTKK